MTTLRITQRTTGSNYYNVEIALEGDNLPRQTASSSFSFKLDAQQQEGIRWYLEDFLDNPHPPTPTIAARIEKNMAEIGKSLFQSVFLSNDDTRDLWATIRGQLNNTRIEITTALEAATSVPWELLRDPKSDRCLALQSVSFVRTHPQSVQRPYLPQTASGNIRILLVICRPGGIDDVPFRSVASRLIKALKPDDHSIFQLDVLRPATFVRLAEVLRTAKSDGKPYHIVHFDGHGAFLDMQALFAGWESKSDEEAAKWLADSVDIDINRFSPHIVYPRTATSGQHGYLLFENPESHANLRFVDGQEIAKLLVETSVPVLVLNACRSAHAESPSKPESDTAETNLHSQVRAFGSLAQEIIDAGVAGVVAMRYNVYVITATQFVGDLYSKLTQGSTLGEAVTLSRKKLADNPLREALDRTYPLEDWCVPIVYEAAPITLFPKKDNEGLNVKISEGQRFSEHDAIDPKLPLQPDIGFFGRDETLLALDRAFDSQSTVLLHAYAGSGKTSTTAEFARWYFLTGGVRGIVFTAFHQYRPLSHLLDQFGHTFQSLLLRYNISWSALSQEEKKNITSQLLKLVPVLWIWDNVEQIAGFPEGSPSVWSKEEQLELKNFLQQMADTKAKFLLTSRRDEYGWLGDLPCRIKISPMPMQDRMQMVKELVKRYGQQMTDVADWNALLRFTRGNPLTITVVVSQILREKLRTKEQIENYLNSIREGENSFEDEESEGRTKSLAASLNYGFANAFSPAEQKPLALLYLFQGFVDIAVLKYLAINELWPESDAVDLAGANYDDLLNRSVEAGLLTRISKILYDIHPAVPWFFKKRFQECFQGRALIAYEAFVDAVLAYGAYFWNRYSKGESEMIVYLKVQEANLLHALRLAKENKWWKYVFEIENIITRLYHHTGRNEEAARITQELISDFIDASESPLPGREQWWERIMLLRAEQFTDARETEKALRVFGLLEDFHRERVAPLLLKPAGLLQTEEKKAIADLAEVLFQKGQYQRVLFEPGSLDTLQKAFDLFVRSGNDDLVATCGSQLGHAYMDIPEFYDIDEAEKWYQRLFDHFKGKNLSEQVRSLHELGQVAYKRFRNAIIDRQPNEAIEALLNKAINYAEDALELAAADDVAMQAIVHHLLGNIYDDAGYPDEAIDNYEKSIQIADRQKNFAFAATIRREVSRALFKIDRKEEALLYAQAALRDLQSLGAGAGEDIRRTVDLINNIQNARQ